MNRIHTYTFEKRVINIEITKESETATISITNKTLEKGNLKAIIEDLILFTKNKLKTELSYLAENGITAEGITLQEDSPVLIRIREGEEYEWHYVKIDSSGSLYFYQLQQKK